MDTRPIGTPITASQRRSYRQTPDDSFYRDFQAAFTRSAPSATSATSTGTGSSSTDAAPVTPPDLSSILGLTHVELANMRGLSTACQADYAAILNRAYGCPQSNSVKSFLGQLNSNELHTLQLNHGLAAPIQVSEISEEGARNLLLPEGYSVDLNHDGTDEVGAGRSLAYPPHDAPASVREAWFQATADMDPGMTMTYALMMHGAMYGIAVDDQSPAGPLAAPDQADSYKHIVSRFLAALEDQKGMLQPGQYERDKAFFSRFEGLLAA